nr:MULTISPECIES: glycosyltransferase family A protein [Clostridia]
MHIASDALIINQSDCVKYECLFYHGYKIECYTFAERGLSRSRNNALLRCTGEILCIADDDMVYTDTYREDIINEFQKHPEADALVFNVTALNDERSGKPIEKYARVGKRESREYGSVHIAIRKRALIGKNVYFNTLFGSGATYSCGEDTLFLKELIEKDLKLYKTPIRIASVDMSDSTWFKGYNEKYFKDKGALIEAAYPRCSYLLAILQSVRNSKKSLGSYKKAAKLFSYYTSGIADYRKVISGGDATEGENIRK